MTPPRLARNSSSRLPSETVASKRRRLGETMVRHGSFSPPDAHPRRRRRRLLCTFAASAATPAPRTTLVSVALGGGWANASSWSARVSGEGRFVVFFSGGDEPGAGQAERPLRPRPAPATDRPPRPRRRRPRDDARRPLRRRLHDGAASPGRRRRPIRPAARGRALPGCVCLRPAHGQDPEGQRSRAGSESERPRMRRRVCRARRRLRRRPAVLFPAKASNIVRGDTNGRVDVFVRDLRARRTRRVSVTPSGAQANGDSSALAISADGRLAFFCSARGTSAACPACSSMTSARAQRGPSRRPAMGARCPR